jgi:hypothetical protein
MTITLDEKAARKAAMREERRKRERANRVFTNLKPHLHPVIEDMADETRVTKNAMVRILLLEALEARGVNLDKVFRDWKEGLKEG